MSVANQFAYLIPSITVVETRLDAVCFSRINQILYYVDHLAEGFTRVNAVLSRLLSSENLFERRDFTSP